MEMNTRLQVEHPVTEAIIGQDLVEWQLRVAAGERLPLLQDELSISGHAIEARIYAEDPARDFMPSVGVLRHLRAPQDARVDSGVREGDRIGSEYDPMIAKLIVHGPTREAALDRLSHALDEYEIVGVRTNLGLLRRLASHPSFRAGEVETGFIGEHPEVLDVDDIVSTEAVAAAAITSFMPLGSGQGPWDVLDSWRMSLPGTRSVLLRAAGREFKIEAQRALDGWRLTWDDVSCKASLEGGILRLDGAVRRIGVTVRPPQVFVFNAGHATVFDIVDPLAPPGASAAGGGRILAPIPGRVVALLVQVGRHGLARPETGRGRGDEDGDRTGRGDRWRGRRDCLCGWRHGGGGAGAGRGKRNSRRALTGVQFFGGRHDLGNHAVRNGFLGAHPIVTVRIA